MWPPPRSPVITFESGRLAKQADGAVVVRGGETMVLATAQGRMETREGADFFPLTVDVEERMYAAGKIPGGFFKREGRPTERAILTARMIDRPIRPLWPKGYKNEVQVICTVLSADMVTPHDILCINSASAALMISPLPFLGPVGAVRIGRVDGQLTVNPTLQEMEETSTLDLVVVGTKEGLTMVEAGGDEIPEDLLLEALELAHGEIVKICETQDELREQAGKAKWLDPNLTAELEERFGDRIRRRILDEGLREGSAVVDEIVDEECPPLEMTSSEDDILRQLQHRMSLDMLLDKIRLAVVEGPVREQFEDDLRALTEAEQDSKELKSAKRQLLFDRIIEGVELSFPVGPATVDGDAPVVKDGLTRQFVKRAAEAIYKELVRRKIAVDKRRPDGRAADEIRPIECEVGVSPRTHGSALFTRGQTQIMSLLTLGTAKEGQRIDDLSLEQERRYMHHYNFPPYSVGETGFMRGPTRRDIGHGALAQRALEMDIKITGVTQEIMRNALQQARQAREFILDKMLEAIPESREQLREHAPRISTIKINPEFIGMVIGKGGETIRALEADHDVQIDIEEDGTILIYATEGTKADAAISAINALTKEPEVGDTYTGKVVKTTQFGAFVELKKGTDGLLHVSNVGPGRVAHIEDVIGRGDVLDVLVQEVDQLVVRPSLDHLALVEHDDLVGVADRREAVCDHDRRPALREAVELLLHGPLRAGVERARGLVEHQNGRV